MPDIIEANAAESSRHLLLELASLARAESARFDTLRVERNGMMLAKVQNRRGLSSLFRLQREWLRVFVEDCLGRQRRRLPAKRCEDARTEHRASGLR